MENKWQKGDHSICPLNTLQIFLLCLYSYDISFNTSSYKEAGMLPVIAAPSAER